MFFRKSSPKITLDYIAKINESIQIIQTAIIDKDPAYEFISSVINTDMVDHLTIIRQAGLNNTKPNNKADKETLFKIATAIGEIATLVSFLSTFTDYVPGAKLEGDIIVDNINVSAIRDIVPVILNNKKDIINNLFKAYQHDKGDIELYDIEFNDIYFDKDKIAFEYQYLTNPMAVGKKFTKYKRGSKRGYKRGSKRGSKRVYKRGSKRLSLRHKRR